MQKVPLIKKYKNEIILSDNPNGVPGLVTGTHKPSVPHQSVFKRGLRPAHIDQHFLVGTIREFIHLEVAPAGGRV